MANKKFGPQYLTADGRFTNERPDWMPEKGIETPKKDYPRKQLSENAAKKIAGVLHIMLNDK
ncbi:MAG: hypothetical protein LBB36_00810 [Fibromonadaceae bacterium]|jgi:hypothetical protein|nr:hypothetical protein [Fibromonadaceae bacterium]